METSVEGPGERERWLKRERRERHPGQLYNHMSVEPPPPEAASVGRYLCIFVLGVAGRVLWGRPQAKLCNHFSWLSIPSVCCQQKGTDRGDVFIENQFAQCAQDRHNMAPKWANSLRFSAELPSIRLHGQLSLSLGENRVQGG